MTHPFRKILEPISIGGVEIRNRVAMAPMGNDYLVNPNGGLNQRGIDYFIERARGGVGLIVTGFFKVENEVEPLPPESAPFVSREAFPSFVELAEAIHSLGAKIFIQLTAGFGPYWSSRSTFETAPGAFTCAELLEPSNPLPGADH